MFADREDAARLLAEKLGEFRGKHPLVLAIPRGAVPMAKIIAASLEGELDVVLVRKLRSPYNPEFAVGSVDETGWCYIAGHAYGEGAGPAYIEREKALQMAVLANRRSRYGPSIDPEGRIVIVVDDGLATGSTMISALHSLRAKKPGKLVCAVPVSPPDTLEKVQALADRTICLDTPKNFQAVGQFYRSFPQIEDEEVIRLLHEKQVS